jgi:hypothetical protein
MYDAAADRRHSRHAAIRSLRLPVPFAALAERGTVIVAAKRFCQILQNCQIFLRITPYKHSNNADSTFNSL